MVRSSRRSFLLVVLILVACGFLGMLFAQRTAPTPLPGNDSDIRDSLKNFSGKTAAETPPDKKAAFFIDQHCACWGAL